MQKDLERMEAETRLEDALKNTAELEAKLEENYSKLIALAKVRKCACGRTNQPWRSSSSCPTY